jgi:hypothetical protein
MDIWYIVCPFRNFVVVWYVLTLLGQEKSDNPGSTLFPQTC